MPSYVLQVPLHGGRNRSFRSWDGVREWISQAERHWEWFTSLSPERPRAWSYALQSVREFFAQVKSVANNSELDESSRRDQILSATKNIFPKGLPLDPDDVVLNTIREAYADGTSASAIAVATVIYSASARSAVPNNEPLGHLSHPVALEALGMAAALRVRWSNLAGSELERVAERASDQVDDFLELGRRRRVEIEEGLAEAQAKAVADLQATVEKADAATSEAIQRIDETRDNYAEVMRLKAPVDYWDGKSTDHKTGVRTYRLWLTGLAAGGAIVLCLVYLGGWWALDTYARNSPTGAVAMTFYVAGFVGAVTAVVLWFIRIVVRLYMSQHHLASDAEERASLLRTYLALSQSGQVSEAERALVLASVFRPTSDGIVKDDGAPSLSPANMLATLLDKR